ncbi:MAG: LLM class F420-dependent oxidoreductase [Acidimicrobiales bacterium]|nr:LLM class F420-dependent oxidoreductase [Acidimicrobiales bacterium]
MELGLTLHLTDRSIDIRDLAVEAEARGFSSLWLPEHTHIPASRRTPIPMGGLDLADEYPRSPDPYVSLAAAAALTERIRLGTGVALVAQHHPINLAKAVASVDALSDGRFTLGIGYGWNVEEMAHHGVEFRSRRAQVREHVLAMRELWTGEVGEYHGEFVDFSPSWTWPKPVRVGGPPVYIGGGAGPKMFAAVAEYADGWLPIGGAGVRAALGDLRAACEERGRDPDEVDVIPFGTLPDEGKLGYYAGLGITEVVLRLPSAPRDGVLQVLDEFTRFID